MRRPYQGLKLLRRLNDMGIYPEKNWKEKGKV